MYVSKMFSLLNIKFPNFIYCRFHNLKDICQICFPDVNFGPVTSLITATHKASLIFLNRTKKC